MTGRWLTRGRLRRSGSAAALVRVLAASGSLDTEHTLIWSLFGDEPARRRDFLWRRMDEDVFYLLSARPPVDSHALFELDEPKAFAPALAVGDAIAFSLRANPVVRRAAEAFRPDGKSRRVEKHDVVMDAMRDLDKSQRIGARSEAIQSAGFMWLKRAGEMGGFAVETQSVRIEGYSQAEIPRKGAKPLCFSTLDFDGRLTVTDPVCFVAKLGDGFGSARGFGCGLMLIRRA
jgi:CRISPR system Cascade subunit CasE